MATNRQEFPGGIVIETIDEGGAIWRATAHVAADGKQYRVGLAVSQTATHRVAVDARGWVMEKIRGRLESVVEHRRRLRAQLKDLDAEFQALSNAAVAEAIDRSK